MAAKATLALCFLAALKQSVLTQCLSPIGAGLAPVAACGAGCSPFTPTASVGGSFVVTSSSPIAPTGVTVVSDSLYEGALVVGGNLPLLGSVGLEGEFPTAGTGAVSYGCGDGAIGVVTEVGPIVTGIVAEEVPFVANIAPEIAIPGYALAGYGPAAPFGYGYGLGYGLGYRFGGYGPGLFGRGFGFGRGCGFFY